MTPSDCIWLMVAMTSRMFTQALYQAASTELSSSRLCGNTTAKRIPKRLGNKGKEGGNWAQRETLNLERRSVGYPCATFAVSGCSNGRDGAGYWGCLWAWQGLWTRVTCCHLVGWRGSAHG